MKNPFLSPDPVRHSVDGQEYNFYPPRTWTISKLRGFLKPLFQALASLGANTDSDIGRLQVNEQEGDSIRQRTELTAIDPVLAKQRAVDRDKTIQMLVDNMASQPAMRSLALLITDSMRDDFDARLGDSDLDKLIDEWTVDQMAQALHGVAKASKELFAPLMERAAPGLTALKGRLSEALEKEPPSEQPPETTKTNSGSE